MLFVCHPKILHKHCLQFLVGVKMAPRETENNGYAKFWGDKQRALWNVVVFSGVVNFTFNGGRKQATAKFSFSFWTWIWFLGIRLKKSSLAFVTVNELEKSQWDWKKANSLSWPSLSWYLKLLNRELKQPRRRPQRRLQKNNRFNDQNNSSARASRFLIHFCDVHCTWTYYDEFPFIFLSLNKILKNSTPGKVACIWHIERIQIDAIKFERTQIHFFTVVCTAVVVFLA